MKAAAGRLAEKQNFFPFLYLLFFLSAVVLLMSACAAKDPADIISSDLPLIENWFGDYPVSGLDRLPAGQQKNGTGYISDPATFIPVWRLFKPTEILPGVDFSKNIVVFSRNVNFYNRTAIVKVTLHGSTLEIIALETMSAMPIEDKVAMAMAVIRRKGVTAIQAGAEKVEVKTGK